MEFMQETLRPLTDFFLVVLQYFYYLSSSMGFESYGMAIILMTIIIKVLLYPLTFKQMRSMRAMQKYAPLMKELQDKYKNNPQLMQQKMQEMYTEHGINPLAGCAGGCLPLLIQMPILMGIYYSLYGLDYPGNSAEFLWLPSLSETDPTYILPVISAVTTYLMQKHSMAQTKTQDDNPQMKIMLYMMPLFIGWISLTFPSGLVLYWATMNVVQLLQQMIIYKALDKEEAATVPKVVDGKGTATDDATGLENKVSLKKGKKKKKQVEEE